jgi:cysteinyl-tRNA synthetase, unknown class
MRQREMQRAPRRGAPPSWGRAALVLVVACGPDQLPPAVVAPAPTAAAERPARGRSVRAHLASLGQGFPDAGPWLAFYGTAAQMGDLERVSRTFRIIDIDADPGRDGHGNFTDDELRSLQAGGQNRVLSYLNLGSCERFRTYWSRAPPGLVPCGENRAAMLGPYAEYPDETWMDPGNADYQRLIVDHVAARLAARGVDGFYLDNLEVVEHAEAGSPEGMCTPACRQGALDLVRRLRERFPDALLVMQNATSEATRLGTTGGVRFASLLDGVAHEDVYSPELDAEVEGQLAAWSALGLRSKTGRAFFVGVEDYVGSCANAEPARSIYARSRRHGFSPYVSDASNLQKTVCYWPF